MSSANGTAAMFDTILSVQSLDADCIERARELFEEYKEKGVIMNSDFSDAQWHLTDEYARTGLSFDISSFAYKKYYENCLGIDIGMFTEYLKCYVLFTVGDMVLHSLQNVVNDIKRIIQYPYAELSSVSESIKLTAPNRVIEFFSTLPEPSNPEPLEQLMDALDQIAAGHYSEIEGRKRPLASFDSYFLFHDIMNDYWKSTMAEEERLFFYPLYLWWKITGVIPLRPREFILTPRECLEEKNDGWYLTLRRNRIKGSGKSIYYRINEDYDTVQYKIPDKLAEEIRIYLDFTRKYESTELETLFITDTHYRLWNQKKHSNSRYFTYVNLSCVLRYFFHDVIEGKYGLTVLHDRRSPYLEDGCIDYLYLGDTRHLALINIIAEGGTPVLAMMLAGHDNIEMSAHYYANITSLIECKTYKQYRKVLKGNVSYDISSIRSKPLNIREYAPLEHGGRCYSVHFMNQDYEDCKKAAGPEGEIGYCPKCTYYRNDVSKDFFHNDDFYKRSIEEDCRYLEQIVRQVRAEKGNSEEILQAMLKLQNSSYTYQQYLQEKMIYEKETEDGQTFHN